jgi:hypothetical protein
MSLRTVLLDGDQVEPTARVVAESMSTTNALVKALNLSSTDLLPWARGVISRCVRDKLSFVVMDHSSVVSVHAGYLPPYPLLSAADFDTSIKNLAPNVAALPRAINTLALLANQHIGIAAPRVFGDEPFTVVYSGPGATAPSHFGANVIRPASKLHYTELFLLATKSNIACWFFSADPAPIALMRRFEAAACEGGRGAAQAAVLVSNNSPFSALNFAESIQQNAAPPDWVQPKGVASTIARAAPLDDWYVGRFSDCNIVYVIKRVSFIFRDLCHSAPCLDGLDSGAPVEVTIVLVPQQPAKSPRL